MRDPLEFPCTVCSADVGQPCLDRQFNVLEVPHTNRIRLAGGRPGQESQGKSAERHQRAVAGVVGAVVGAAVDGPAGAALGVVAASALEPLVERVWMEIQADGRRRAVSVVQEAASIAGEDPEAFAERMNATEQTRLLSASAISAATRTVYEPKIRALGRVLAAGLDNDCERIDDEQLLMAALADMEAPHAILLELLVKYKPGWVYANPARAKLLEREQEFPAPWTANEIIGVRRSLEPVLPGLLGTLQRHGLITTRDTLAEALEKYGRAVEQAQSLSYGHSGGPSSASLSRDLPATQWIATPQGAALLGRLLDESTGDAAELGEGA